MKTKYYRIEVIVEKQYVKIVKAVNYDEACMMAERLRIQDDVKCYDGTDVMEPIVEKCNKDGDDIE